MPAATGQMLGSVAGSISARQFICARCGRQEVVCSACDRGRRYCCSECSLQARRASLRRAGCRYQSSRAGRVAHAQRARRYRQRRRWASPPPTPLEPVLAPAPPPLAPPPPPTASFPSSRPNSVTHQSSRAAPGGDVLAAKFDELVEPEAPAPWRCGWCARAGCGELRGKFLGRGTWPQLLAPGRRRGTSHGATS